MATKKKKSNDTQRPITMAEWCDNIEHLKRNPEMFSIPDALVSHISLSEYNVSVPVIDDSGNNTGEDEEILVLEIALITNMGSNFAKGSICRTSELTNEMMLAEMMNVISFLIEMSGFDNNRLPDGGWIDEDLASKMYDAVKEKNEIN